MDYEQRLASLTAAKLHHSGIIDAMRFIACASIDGHGLAAKSFLDKFAHSPSGDAVRRAWREDGRWELTTKAASNAATTTTTGYAAELLPPSLLTALSQRLSISSVLGKIPNVQRAPFKIPLATETQAPSVAWVAEGGAKPVTQATFGKVTLNPTKLAGILVLTEELVKLTRSGDVDAAVLMGNLLTDASTRKLDIEFLNPAAAPVAGLSPGSITNGATAVTATGNLANDLASLVSAFYTQRPNAVAPCFVLSPAIAGKVIALGTHHDLRTTGGTLLGLPAVLTPGAGTTITLLEAPAIYVNDNLARVDVTREAALQLNSTPDSPPTAATVVVDLWSTNRVGVLVDRYASWQRDAVSAVAYLTVA